MLLSPLKLGRIALANRVVMAPVTSNRAAGGSAPGDLPLRASAAIRPQAPRSPMAPWWL